MNPEIFEEIRKKGLLLDKDVFQIISILNDPNKINFFLEKLEILSGKKILGREVLQKNLLQIKKIFNENFNQENEYFINYLNNSGLNINSANEFESNKSNQENLSKNNNLDYRVFYAETKPDKKLEVKDFVGNFRARYSALQRILMNRGDLSQNLVSINKIGNDRSAISIIGCVVSKRITKNKNLIIKFEDLTGEINALVRFDREDIFEKGKELQLDDIVAIKASGNREMLFVSDIIFPDSFNFTKTKFEEDSWIVFLSDVHCGSVKHLSKSFSKFLDWLESDKEIAPKIKYIFFSGDNVDGVGIFPGQEFVLKQKTMVEQYGLLASYLKRIPKRITIFMCPGQHDASRVAEPQPIIPKAYAPQLYEIENLVLVTNPALVKLLEKDKEFKVLMYHGAYLHNFINEIPELREIKAHKCPAKAVKHALKRRHLGPTHSEAVYIPNSDKDPLVISEVPDILCTGEMHRLDIETYNGTLIIVGSCWQGQTDFEEKVGNIPDPAKVPMVNLKTRELKIFDFSDEEELNELN